MAMPKARVILKVERGPENPAVAVKVREHDYSTRTVTLRELSGAELMRAAANVGVGGGPGVAREDRERAIVAKVWGEDFQPREFVPHRQTDDTPRVETPKVDAPKVEETPKVETPKVEQTDATDAVAKAIADLLASVEPAAPVIDAEQVRSIVGEAVAEAIAEIRESLPVRQIQLPGHDVSDLPDLAHETLPALIQAVGCCLGAQASGATLQYPYLVGPAGSGKSTVARHAADAHGLECREMSLSPDLLRTGLFGFIDAVGNYHSTPLRDAYENGHLLVLDEIDNGNAGILAGLNQLLANGGCSFPDGYVKRHPRFVAIATGNTFGLGPDAQYVGRARLDAATLNRFVTFYVGYDQKLERSLALGYATDETRDAVVEWIDTARAYRRNAEGAKLQVVISPRDILTGAAYVASGMSVKDAAERVIFAPMTEDTRFKVAGV